MKFVKGLIVVSVISFIFFSLTVVADRASGGKISSRLFSENFRLQTVSSEMFQGVDIGNNLF